MTRKINHEERAADLLEAAAHVLEERGWDKGILVNHEGQVCAVGAVRAAAGMEDLWARPRTKAYALAMEALANLLEFGLPSMKGLQHSEDIVIDWNDAGWRRNDKDIREGFLHAAKDLRNKAVPDVS